MQNNSVYVWAGNSVLVVDDYQSIRKAVRELAESLSLKCDEAQNGIEAQEKLRSNPPDLVISDLVMPEMDGFELIEAIKTSPEWRRIPVVTMSTHSATPVIYSRP